MIAKAVTERAALLTRSVELPDGLIDNAGACDAVSRGAKGQKLWPLMALGKGTAKALVSAILLDGAPVREEDIDGWRHTAAVNRTRCHGEVLQCGAVLDHADVARC